MAGFPKTISSLLAVDEYMSSGISSVSNTFIGWVTREKEMNGGGIERNIEDLRS